MKFNLVLSQEILQIVGDALLELPAKRSIAAINEINRQIQEQLIKNEKNQNNNVKV